MGTLTDVTGYLYNHLSKVIDSLFNFQAKYSNFVEEKRIFGTFYVIIDQIGRLN